MNHTKTLTACWRGKSDPKPLHATEIKRVAKALFSLQRGLTGERRLAGAGYMDTADLLGAYLLYYFPVTHRQITLALTSFLNKTDLLRRPRLRLLDVGCGPAPAAAAAIDLLGSKGFSRANIDLHLIDSSSKALQIAKKLFSEDFPNIRPTLSQGSLEKPITLKKNRYDIILASHVVNELWKDAPDALSRRRQFLELLSDSLTEGGVLLLCEPALLETSRAAISLAVSLSQDALRILAPCPEAINETRSCPIFEKGQPQAASCHAEVLCEFDASVTAIAKEAGLTRESVKMTFFALQKGKRSADVQKPELRVVSEGMLNKSGRIRYLFCDGKKRFPISAVSTSKKAEAIGFFRLKRYDSVQFENLEARGDSERPAFGISENTRLSVCRFSETGNKGSQRLLQAKSRERKNVFSNKPPVKKHVRR